MTMKHVLIMENWRKFVTESDIVTNDPLDEVWYPGSSHDQLEEGMLSTLGLAAMFAFASPAMADDVINDTTGDTNQIVQVDQVDDPISVSLMWDTEMTDSGLNSQQDSAMYRQIASGLNDVLSGADIYTGNDLIQKAQSQINQHNAETGEDVSVQDIDNMGKREIANTMDTLVVSVGLQKDAGGVWVHGSAASPDGKVSQHSFKVTDNLKSMGDAAGSVQNQKTIRAGIQQLLAKSL